MRSAHLSLLILAAGCWSGPPSPDTVSGTYATMFDGGVSKSGATGNAPVTLKLDAVDAMVSGVYAPTAGAAYRSAPGRVSGRLTANVLEGTWSDVLGASGGFILTFSDDRQSFEGSWTATTSRGAWIGRRDDSLPVPELPTQVNASGAEAVGPSCPGGWTLTIGGSVRSTAYRSEGACRVALADGLSAFDNAEMRRRMGAISTCRCATP